MTGKELQAILNDMTEEQLEKDIETHNHYHGEWSKDVVVEFNEDHNVIDISIDCFKKDEA